MKLLVFVLFLGVTLGRDLRQETECTNGDEVCEKYTDSDLDAYCADESTGVPEVCCAACAAHSAKRAMPKTFLQMRQEECTNGDEICEKYTDSDLDAYCADDSTGVPEVCCAACAAH